MDLKKIFLNAVCPRQRILENSDFWSEKGEQNEKRGERAQGDDGDRRRTAGERFGGKQIAFVEIGDGGGDEENGDVDPIGGFADDAVVGVEKHGN